MWCKAKDWTGRWVAGEQENRDGVVYVKIDTTTHKNQLVGLISVDPETLCQAVPMTDKCGKQLYHGDVVKITYKEYRYGEDTFYSSVELIVQHKGVNCFCTSICGVPFYRPLDNFEAFKETGVDVAEVEFIYSVFDHPELMPAGVKYLID